MQPTLPLEAFIERCKFCDHPRYGASKHFCTTCLPPLSQWANIKDYGKHYNILRSAIGVGQEGQNKCRIPRTHPAYIHPPTRPTSPARVIQKNCSQCNTQFQGKQGGSDHCSYKCSRITALDKLRQGRLTRIQIQADELFPRSNVDLTAFAALVTDFLSKQTHTLYKRPRRKRERHNDAPIRCNMCQQPFTRTGTAVRKSYCETCSPKVLRWYHTKGPAPLLAERQCARCITMFRPQLGKPTKFCSTPCSAITIQPMPLTCRLMQCADCNTPCKPRGKATRCERCQFITTATRKDANSARRAHIERAGDKGISWRTVGVCLGL